MDDDNNNNNKLLVDKLLSEGPPSSSSSSSDSSGDEEYAGFGLDPVPLSTPASAEKLFAEAVLKHLDELRAHSQGQKVDTGPSEQGDEENLKSDPPSPVEKFPFKGLQVVKRKQDFGESVSEQFRRSLYPRCHNDMEVGKCGAGNSDSNDEDSSPFDIIKSVTADRLKGWRQAALGRNAPRQFRYTLDLKKEEEKIAKIRTHAQIIKAAFLFKEAEEQVQGERTSELIANAVRMSTHGKGILDAHKLSGINVEYAESNGWSAPAHPFFTSGALQYFSGVILSEGVLCQKITAGKSFVEVLKEGGVLPGIKVDKGTVELAGTNGETTTQGLDDLAQRCLQYYAGGARFAMWRAVLRIGLSEPSQLAINENAYGLAQYAIICQVNGLVPIIELEILADGPHDIDKCAEVTEGVLAAVFKALHDRHVLLEGTLLKLNMVTPGSDAPKVAPEVVAEYTVRTLQRTMPAAVPAVVFSSGGQRDEEATLNLNAMNKLQGKKPWGLSFSFEPVLQQRTLEAWAGKEENVENAQVAFLARCKANSEAALGTYQGCGA